MAEKDDFAEVERLLVSADALGAARKIIGCASSPRGEELFSRCIAELRKRPRHCLGLERASLRGADGAELVRKAFRRAALLYHPDKQPRAAPLFVCARAAHDELLAEWRRWHESAERVPAGRGWALL